jgi:translocation and assembly module TamB
LPDLRATATVQSLPLAALAGLGGQPDLQGTLSGEAALTGSLSTPEGSFKLSGAGLSTEALKQLGVRPMTASASGTLSGGTLNATLKADAGKQLTVTGNGAVDLRTSRIDMALKGRTGPALFADPWPAVACVPRAMSASTCVCRVLWSVPTSMAGSR